MKVVQHCFPVVLFTRWLQCLNILTKSLNVTIQMKCFGSMIGLYCLFCNVPQNIILCSFDLASSWERGGVVDSALDFRSQGGLFEAQSLPLCCFLRQETLPQIVSLHPGV